MIERTLQKSIEQKLFNGKVIILLGARQVGKTTLFEQMKSTAFAGMPVTAFDCDEPNDRALLTNANSADLSTAVKGSKIVLIDEAQRVQNIGLTVKLLADKFKDIQVLVSGSSSLELANKLNEPLTGRKFEFLLLPVSTEELIKSRGTLETQRLLESRLIYGSYPDILFSQNNTKELLYELTNSYLFKDLYALQDVRKPETLEKLLIALALQIGSEVSYNELAQTIGSDVKTVERYINLLEQCFIVFKLTGLNRNIRNELKKSKKIFFYDNGIRNALIQAFLPLNLRNDVGAMWENFFISERLKFNNYHNRFTKMYFWRTQTQQEIDLVEESEGQFRIFEMKWNENRKASFPENFVNAYNPVEKHIVTPKNYTDFLDYTPKN
jgi:predicted AAA+ superfamily ATPase